MMVFLLVGITVLVLDRIFNVTRRNNLVFLSLVFSIIFLIHLTVSVDHVLVKSTGGSLRNLIVSFILLLVIISYVFLLKKAKNIGKVKFEKASTKNLFNPEELNRYARHIVLKEIGGLGQKKLKNAKILVIGAGGLGSPVLQYLGAGGIGTIGVVDSDLVDNSNLQRQIIYTDKMIGDSKVFAASQAIRAQNPYTKVLAYNYLFNEQNADDLISNFDLIIDGTDNAQTRYLVNKTCVKLKKPLISGAISQWEGQVMVYTSTLASPCYQCVFPNISNTELAASCSETGVVGALPGVIGSIMAVEAIKLISGAGELLDGRLMIYDALHAETRIIKLNQDINCPVCSIK